MKPQYLPAKFRVSRNRSLPPRFNQVQYRVRLMAPSCQAIPPVVPLSIFSPVTVPLPPKTPAASPSAAASPASAACGGGSDIAAGEKPSEGGGGKKDKKKKSKSGEGGDANGTAAAPGAAKKGKESAAPPAPAATEVVEGDPSKLDVRVGVIVKAWEHPDSEKLFCEEIDLGEVSSFVAQLSVDEGARAGGRH